MLKQYLPSPGQTAAPELALLRMNHPMNRFSVQG
jgi:hypothetical protein